MSYKVTLNTELASTKLLVTHPSGNTGLVSARLWSQPSHQPVITQIYSMFLFNDSYTY